MIESLGNNVLCCAHTLQLCVTKALKNDEIFKLLKIIRSTVGHFKHSTTTNAFIEKYQTVLLVPEHQLIQDVATRWNSLYYMLERFLEQKSAIYAVLIEQNKINLINELKDSDFLVLKELVTILIPFEEATTLISAEKNYIVSIILPIINQLKILTRKVM